MEYQEILTPTAIAAARNAAQERKVTNVTFVQGDITSFTSFEGWFDHRFGLHAAYVNEVPNEATNANLLIDQVSFTAHAVRAHQKPLL